MLQELRALGVRLSIDDFGTGYSSLSHLQRFPLNMLKIDQSFAQDITRNAANASITRAIISLAHSMNLAVLAEGVETDEQVELLHQYECDQVQGHFYGYPMPEEEFVRLLSGAIPTKCRERAA